MTTATLESKNAANSPPRRRGLVLIVDDEEQNRMLLRDPLEMHGYEIVEVENGEQALKSVAEYAPDVVLLDVMMPGLDGFEVCRRLKNDPVTAPIPILMITALSERKERMIGIAAGANDFLNKPVDIQDMTLRVRNAAQMKQLFDQLRAEQEKSDRLLKNVLPETIAKRMKDGELNIADHFQDTTVLVADLVGFTTLSNHVDPAQVVLLLNETSSAFDELAGKSGLEKIKTIGDAYMVAGGIPLARPDHPEAIAAMALEMREEIERLNREYNTSLRIRIGINTGPLIAGVIGRKKFAYDLWGVTVNVACRLEALGEGGSITVAESTYQRLKNRFRFQRKRVLDLKGQGEVIAYELGGQL